MVVSGRPSMTSDMSCIPSICLHVAHRVAGPEATTYRHGPTSARLFSAATSACGQSCFATHTCITSGTSLALRLEVCATMAPASDHLLHCRRIVNHEFKPIPYSVTAKVMEIIKKLHGDQGTRDSNFGRHARLRPAIAFVRNGDFRARTSFLTSNVYCALSLQICVERGRQ
jgi:hypothetical protein